MFASAYSLNIMIGIDLLVMLLSEALTPQVHFVGLKAFNLSVSTAPASTITKMIRGPKTPYMPELDTFGPSIWQILIRGLNASRQLSVIEASIFIYHPSN